MKPVRLSYYTDFVLPILYPVETYLLNLLSTLEYMHIYD